MKKTHLRLIALLLAVMMALSLAACSKKEGESGNNPDSAATDNSGKTNNGGSGNGGNSQNGTADNSYGDFVYTATYQRVNPGEEVENMNGVVYGGDRLYMQANVKTGEKVTEYWDEDGNPVTDEEKIAAGEYADSYEYEKTAQTLCSMALDGTDFQILENFHPTALPEGSEGSAYINNMRVDREGNIWIAEEVYAYHYDEDGVYYDDGDNYYIRRLDKTGAELANVDLAAYKGDQDYFYLDNFCLDAEGRLYITTGENTIYVIGQDGSQLCKLNVKDGTWINGLVCLRDGTVGVTVNGENGSQIFPIDVDAKALGEGVKLPANIWRLIDGGGEYDCYYNNNLGLSGLNLETGESVDLVNWIDSDIDSSNLSNIIPLDDGRILAVSYTSRGERPSYEVVTLTKADPATLPQKEILNYACMWLDYNIRTKIIDFNKTSDRYRIRVTDYSTFNTEEDYSAGLTKLTTEITSGKVPDILSLDGMPVSRYIARGILEDLAPYIDSDPELGPDALVPGVRKALTVNGGIYQAASSFTVHTVIGASRIVGDKMGWTVKDLQAALAQMPAGCAAFNDMTRDDILHYIATMNQDDYVNWETGEVNFNNQEFIDLLEFVKTFPKEIDYSQYEDGGWEPDYEKIKTGKIMLTVTNLGDFEEFRRYKQFYGGDITFVGFPTAEGTGSVAEFSSSYGISSACKNKDAAWSFLRTLFTESYQNGDDGYYYYGYPTNQKVMDARIREAMTEQTGTDENGEVVVYASSSYWIDEDTEIELYAATQEEIDQLMELINNMESGASFDEDITKIISEEAQAFFEGQKSAQDVAGVIQSRVWIYVNEVK